MTDSSTRQRSPRLLSRRALSGYAACVLAFMVLVILEGAVVRATGSGAGCGNHWPLCNGEVIPHHPRIATIIEFAHRSLTGICTTLVMALIAGTFLGRPKGDRARRAVVWTGVLLVTEALLGALLVKGGYVLNNASDTRVVVQCVHFTNTMLLVGALTLTWWWLRNPAPPDESLLSPENRSVAWIAIAATLLTGATGSVAALADTLFPSPSLRAGFAQDFSAAAPLLVRMRWIHPASALLALGCTLWLAFRLRSAAGRWIVALIALQIVLGVGDVLLLAPVWLQVLHLLGADLYWIALVAACSGLLTRRPAFAAAPHAVLHSIR
jgi:cytochrome c oxidase assembly protein subunit 15